MFRRECFLIAISLHGAGGFAVCPVYLERIPKKLIFGSYFLTDSSIICWRVLYVGGFRLIPRLLSMKHFSITGLCI